MKTLIIFCLFSISILAQAQSVEQRIFSLETQLKAVEGMIDRTPYMEEQHLVIESYFKMLTVFALDIKDYSNTSKAFNNYVGRYGAETFCKKTFLDNTRWSHLIANCSKNGFFLCAEEVRGFSAAKKSLKESLRDNLKSSFETSKYCNN